MMLDHTRDFVHRYVMQGFDPTDLAHTSVKLFFTRWITHFCAPIFVFLAGTGIYLQAARGKSRGELSRFLVTRGLWLIVLEFTAVRIAVTFNFDYRFLGIMQVENRFLRRRVSGGRFSELNRSSQPSYFRDGSLAYGVGRRLESGSRTSFACQRDQQ
jgi:hypothetical protein